jgi:hypothetical protein
MFASITHKTKDICGQSYIPHAYYYYYLLLLLLLLVWAGIAQSVYRLATGLMVRGSNPGCGEVFRTRLDRPWGLPILLYNGYQVFPGGKAAWAWR